MKGNDLRKGEQKQLKDLKTWHKFLSWDCITKVFLLNHFHNCKERLVETQTRKTKILSKWSIINKKNKLVKSKHVHSTTRSPI